MHINTYKVFPPEIVQEIQKYYSGGYLRIPKPYSNKPEKSTSNQRTVIFLKYILVTVLLVTSWFGIADAETSQENLQRDFVDHLFRNKEYFRAITEADRYIFYYPDGIYIEDMKILIADSYAQGGDEVVALQRYDNFLSEYPHSPKVPSVYLRIGKLYADNREYGPAKQYFEKIILDERTSESLTIKAKEWILLCLLLLDSKEEEIKNIIDDYLNSADFYTLEFQDFTIYGFQDCLLLLGQGDDSRDLEAFLLVAQIHLVHRIQFQQRFFRRHLMFLQFVLENRQQQVGKIADENMRRDPVVQPVAYGAQTGYAFQGAKGLLYQVFVEIEANHLIEGQKSG